jgi:hypothetical protein
MIKVSTPVGVIIIFATAIVLFGGVFAYQYFAKPVSLSEGQTQQTQTQNINIQDVKVLSDSAIISSINKLENVQLVKNAKGVYEAKYPQMAGGYNVNLISRGDLNGDGYQDAFVWGTWCGASCGSIFTVILNKENGILDTFRVVPEGFVSSSAAQYGVKNIVINNGIISMQVEIPAYDGLVTNTTLNYKLAGQNLESVNQTAGWKTHTNTEYGFEIKYPSNKWRLTIDNPMTSFLHRMYIVAITKQDDFAGSVGLYIQNGDLDSWLKDKAAHTRETVFINGLQAEKFYFGRDLKTDTSFTYVFERNNLVYVINTVHIIENNYGISDSDVSQILSTFKFTN